LIVDRAKDRDGADKLWVTSKNESSVGAELTLAKDETATVAGASIGERTNAPRAEVPGRDGSGRPEAEAKNPSTSEKEAGKGVPAAVTAGTVGQIAKFTTTTELGSNSVINELNGNVGIGTPSPTSVGRNWIC
jgi:hypothetical protein